MTEAKNQITQYRENVRAITSDQQVFLTLANNSFKGVDVKLIPPLLLEAQMRGLTIEDFMTKKAYAIPYGKTAQIVQSIEHCRAIAAKAGQSGKSEPAYTREVIDQDKEGKDLYDLACSVTVYREGGDARGYTAKVYLSEYYTGNKNPDGTIKRNQWGEVKPTLWDTKPRTMLAKVAEMHALRSAFPEKLSGAYVEEEMQQAQFIDITDPEEQEHDAEAVILVTEAMDAANDLETLEDIYKSADKKIRLREEVIKNYGDNKKRIQDTMGAKTEDAGVVQGKGKPANG